MGGNGESKNNRNVCSAAANALMVYAQYLHPTPSLFYIHISWFFRLFFTSYPYSPDRSSSSPLSSHSHFKRRKFMRFFFFILGSFFLSLSFSLVAMRRRHLRDSFTTQSASNHEKLFLFSSMMMMMITIWLSYEAFFLHEEYTCVYTYGMGMKEIDRTDWGFM